MSENITRKFIGRIVAGAYYDYQEVRISTQNRIRDIIRKKIEGIPFDAVEEKKEKKEKKTYTDKQLFNLWEDLLSEGKITQKEYEYVQECWLLSKKTQKTEDEYKKAMLKYIKTEPVYKQFLSKIRGIGPVLSANLIKEFGTCSNYSTVSKLWCHTGNHTVKGKAPKLKKGKDIRFSPRLRTLTWKISDCLMKQNKALYRNIYDTEKQKQLNREYPEGQLAEDYQGYEESDTHLTRGHAHNRALRKMRKVFLDHYWHAARETHGLEAKKSYVEGVLGHENYINWLEAVAQEEG